MPGKMMDPAFLAQLGHNCVDPREPRLCLQQKRTISPPQRFPTRPSYALQGTNPKLKPDSRGNESRYRFPFVEPLCIFIPMDLKADGVPSHLGEVLCRRCHRIEEFPPQELPLERHRGQRVVLGLQNTRDRCFSSCVPLTDSVAVKPRK